MKEPTKLSEQLARGLSYIMEPGSTGPWRHLDGCNEFVVQHGSHPFDLPLPPRRSRKIVFTGGGCNQSENMVVVSFLAHIRFWTGIYGGHEIIGLRVITMPFINRNAEHHYVFFEVQVAGGIVLVSGETTDFLEGTRADMLKLEDVFALLARVYQLKIERASVPAVKLRMLYNDAGCIA